MLSDFSKEEQVHLPDVLNALVKYIDLLMTGNDADFMTQVSEYLRE